MPRPAPSIVLCLLLVLLAPRYPSAHAQAPDTLSPGALPLPPPANLDQQLLYAIYQVDDARFQSAMTLANQSSYPAFYAGVPAAWAGVWLLRGGGDWSDAYRLTVSQVAAIAGFSLLKNVFRRPRPSLSMPGIAARFDAPGQTDYKYSFPSGHTAVAFAMASSWSLSHPRWHVVAPSLVWAAGTGLSRVWMGDHYPSDVLAGALLGTAIGWSVHRWQDHLTPLAFRGSAPAPQAPVFFMTTRF